MRAFVVHGPGRHALTELPDPVAGPGEVLVEPAVVGVCGSDLELADGRRPAGFVRYPVVPGHEWSGRIAAVGPGVSGFDVGAPVVAEGVRGCGACARCAEGRSNLCAGPYAETGFTHAGALADLIAVPARLVHSLPDGASLEAAALIEPAACVANALLEVGLPAAGCRVAVVGDGPLGLLAVLLLRLSEPAELVVLGHRPERLAEACAFGAGAVRLDASGREPALRGMFDLVVEVTNSAAGAATAVAVARRGGTVALLGISGAGLTVLDPDLVSLGQLRVQGSFAASPAAWRWTVDRYAEGAFDPAALITHRFGLRGAAQALAVVGDRDAKALKVVVLPGADRVGRAGRTGRPADGSNGLSEG
jgi:threonine dehydrogenase-like Zn-dependent dehydrogenase